MPHISLQMYTMRDYVKTEEDLRRTYRRIADIGYKTVQPILPGFMTAQAFQDMLDEYGMKADSFSYGGADIAEKLPLLKATAEALHTPFLRGGAVSKEASYELSTMREAVKDIEQRAKICNDNGLRYLYHFHAYEFVDYGCGTTGMDILLNEAPHVEFQPDVHWMAAAGYEPSNMLKMFAGRAPYLHMQGYAIHPDPVNKSSICDATVPVGQGSLNWEGIMQAGRELGIELYVAEQDYCYIDTFESIKQSFDALRGYGVDA